MVDLSENIDAICYEYSDNTLLEKDMSNSFDQQEKKQSGQKSNIKSCFKTNFSKKPLIRKLVSFTLI